ncbi:DUF4389 domain-containing protein [Amycolatopsis acidicola]|uniref:DUF4389 domain-containing protein n=1 Tax=Amycolatopsis acidicola TaxID=2596893 RepID=A0A5N0V4Z8_9PSEU|nr:DUF4389 domain-containing protein [Amycolatopsis acidicola]KAA9160211.1 DUF4389 domain-containing protein [Amycolatopsis acidicola]
MDDRRPYPVRVEADLDPNLSRWLWLVKWLLAVPHYFLLALLWAAFAVLTVVAFFAILVTGRYPRTIFDFNVGVLRWSWRVHYYAYAALGTDAYPPFTLADVPAYPARLEIDYPERLSRGLVLVKWWLLALPQYVIVGLFAGGGAWFVGRSEPGQFHWAAGGLIGVLVLVAGVVLLVTGSYPKPVFDFVLGMDRWVVRVGAYAALMTDDYPPFRLDMGGTDPAGPSRPDERTGWPAHRWTGGRVASVVLGAVLALTSMGLLTGGGALLWADRSARDADGYLTTTESFSTSQYALSTGKIVLGGWPASSDVLGDVRVRVTETNPATPVFVGIATSADAGRYLAGVGYATVRTPSSASVTVNAGGAPAVPPESAGIWAVRSAGPGTQTVSWPLRAGDWTLVVMRPDGAPGLDVRAEAGATIPGLPWIATGVLGAGAVLLLFGALLIAVPVHRASRQQKGEEDAHAHRV